jgi:hypothetical protein
MTQESDRTRGFGTACSFERSDAYVHLDEVIAEELRFGKGIAHPWITFAWKYGRRLVAVRGAMRSKVLHEPNCVGAQSPP